MWLSVDNENDGETLGVDEAINVAVYVRGNVHHIVNGLEVHLDDSLYGPSLLEPVYVDIPVG